MLWLLVGLGGALGSLLRFFLQGQIQTAIGGRFPWGTLVINVVGSAVIGAVAAWIEKQPVAPQHARAFVMVGILGGFTTFSSFSLENMNLLRAGEGRTAVLYVVVSNAAGIALALLSFVGVKTLLRG